ncbi:MAG: hypothetical protein ACC635_01700 [Acidiferrobacterales bacterium]
MKLQTNLTKNILFIIPVIILSSFTDAHARGMEVMKDPVELYYATPGKISGAQAKKVVLGALAKTKKPVWKKRSSKKGVIRVEAEQGRLYAAVDIYMDREGIKIVYVDSERMRFRERKNKKYIRDMYNKWVKSLGKELKKSASSRYKLKLVSARSRYILKGIAAGKELVVIAVRAVPDINRRRNTPVWSAQITKSLAVALSKKYGEKHVYSGLEWSKETQNLVKNGYKVSQNKLACDANESSGVITVGIDIDSTDTDGGSASEDMTITYFNCDTGKLIIKTVEGYYARGDAYNLETATRIQVGYILNEAGF